MSLIDQTYFINEINLPQGTYSDTAGEITRYEQPLLIDLFGYELAKLVADYAVGSPQRIKDIVDGKEFTVTGVDGLDRLVKWRGLINSEKKSIIAYHVYYWHLKNSVTMVSGTGSVKATSENAVNADVSQKCMTAYNLFMDEFEMIFVFMSENAAIYPEWSCDLSQFTTDRINTLDL